jgi:hypothetical protein
MNNDALVIADMKTIIESTYTSDRIEDIVDLYDNTRAGDLTKYLANPIMNAIKKVTKP